MKAIFLDIDGVMNCKDTPPMLVDGQVIFIDTRMLERLTRIIDETDAVVVLSSDWRWDRDDPSCNQEFLALQELMREWGIEFYGYTPGFDDDRSTEIRDFLFSHKEITEYVVIDDRSDANPDSRHFVKTAMSLGLTDELTEDAIKILNNIFD